MQHSLLHGSLDVAMSKMYNNEVWIGWVSSYLVQFLGICNSNVEILHLLVFSLCDSKLHKCKTFISQSACYFIILAVSTFFNLFVRNHCHMYHKLQLCIAQAFLRNVYVSCVSTMFCCASIWLALMAFRLWSSVSGLKVGIVPMAEWPWPSTFRGHIWLTKILSLK